MSLQAIAGVAFDRRNPTAPRVVAAQQAQQAAAAGAPSTQGQQSAEKVNAALETLKRYIPTELLALYLPFVAITQSHFAPDSSKAADVAVAAAWSFYIYVGFLVATPVVICMMYVAKAVEARAPWTFSGLPYLEALLGIAAFAIWGASVPGVFAAQQWWLGLAALASSLFLPLIDTTFSKR